MAPRKRVSKYSNEDLLRAVAAVKTKSLSLRNASEKYGVPHTTIKDRVSGRYAAKILEAGMHNVFLNLVKKLPESLHITA